MNASSNPRRVLGLCGAMLLRLIEGGTVSHRRTPSDSGYRLTRARV